MEMVHLVAIFKKILCDQYNFSKWKILQKCDIWRKIAKSSTICYILQRMGWATRGRLMCEVRLQTSNEGSNRAYMWSRPTTSHFVNRKVSFEILRTESFYLI